MTKTKKNSTQSPSQEQTMSRRKRGKHCLWTQCDMIAAVEAVHNHTMQEKNKTGSQSKKNSKKA